MNPIPSRTRPLNSSAPMVLWLKPWESRSLPGLPKTKQFLLTCHDQRNAALLREAAFLFLSISADGRLHFGSGVGRSHERLALAKAADREPSDEHVSTGLRTNDRVQSRRCISGETRLLADPSRKCICREALCRTGLFHRRTCGPSQSSHCDFLLCSAARQLGPGRPKLRYTRSDHQTLKWS
jgi:hypothetical protein